MEYLASAVTITPVLERRLVIGGLETDSHANVIAGWDVSFVTPKGTFTYRGETVGDAVREAFANESSWA